jgi:nucleotide sugar dehydrogenase
MKKVCIQGIGFVGAAMAVAVAMARDRQGWPLYQVVGVDVSSATGIDRVKSLNKGRFPFPTDDTKLLQALEEAFRVGNLSATTDQKAYSDADIIVVDVPLDLSFNANKAVVEFDNFIEAIRQIGKRVQSGSLVIVETTVPPGTCEKIVVPVLRDELGKRGIGEQSVMVAYSYERVMPGADYLNSIVNIWRVYSGYTDEAAIACSDFFSTIVNTEKYPLTRLDTMTAVETAKVMENTYRAVNIAFIQEWTEYAERLGIDLYEVIEAIRCRPTHSNMRVPGLGVGGYCLTKDPLFAPVSARDLFKFKDLEFPFSHLAVEVNQRMPQHTINRLKSLFKGKVQGKKVLICGAGYRQDIGDTRYSPSEYIVLGLEKLDSEVDVYDPYINYWAELDRTLPDRLPDPTKYDAIVFAVPHTTFMTLNVPEWLGESSPIILDATNVLGRENRDDLRKRGIRVESIGRGGSL